MPLSSKVLSFVVSVHLATALDDLRGSLKCFDALSFFFIALTCLFFGTSSFSSSMTVNFFTCIFTGLFVSFSVSAPVEHIIFPDYRLSIRLVSPFRRFSCTSGTSNRTFTCSLHMLLAYLGDASLTISSTRDAPKSDSKARVVWSFWAACFSTRRTSSFSRSIFWRWRDVFSIKTGSEALSVYSLRNLTRVIRCLATYEMRSMYFASLVSLALNSLLDMINCEHLWVSLSLSFCSSLKSSVLLFN